MRSPTVSSVMTRDVIAVRAQTPFVEVARLLTAKAISGVPVTDSDGRLLGVVSEADLLPKEAAQSPDSGSLFATHAADRDWRRQHATTAGQLMTRRVRTIAPDELVSQAAQSMLEWRVRRLFVVDRGGFLLGVLARRDLLRVFLHSDEQIRSAVRREVFDRTLHLDPDRFRIEVDEGLVSLTGVVADRNQARLASRLVSAMPGVVAVVDHLGYDRDEVGDSAERVD